MSLRPTPFYRGIVGAAAICLLSVVAGSGAYASSPAAAPKAGSHWQIFAGNAAIKSTSLAIDAPGRVLYAFSQDPNRTAPATLQAWDLNRRTPLTPRVVLPSSVAVSSAMPIAVDSADRAVFVAVNSASEGAPSVIVAKRAGSSIAVRAVTSRFPATYSIVGMTVDARRGVVYLIGEPSVCPSIDVCPSSLIGAGSHAVEVDRLSLASLSNGTVSSPYAAPLAVPADCGQIITFNFPAQAVVSADGNHLFFGCATNRGDVLTPQGPNAGDVAGVADLNLAQAAANGPSPMQLQPVPGDFSDGDSIAVPADARLILVAPAAGATNLKVYDTVHGYYVGAVGVDNNQVFGIGVDAANGVGYYIDRRGITSVDFTALPVPQGNLDDGVKIEGPVTVRTVAIDPVTHHVYVAGSDDLTGGTSPFAVTYKGTGPTGSDDAFSSDGFAGIDAPEIAGVTDSERVVTMGATGADERLAGGTYNLFVNTTHHDPRCEAVRCGTRDLAIGVLNGVQLTNDEATAQAVTEVQDNATTDDETPQTPTSYPQPVPSQVPAPPSQYQITAGYAPPVPVGCADFGAAPTPQSAENESVFCDHMGQHVKANATAEPGRLLVNAPCTQVGQPKPGDPICAPAGAGGMIPDPVSVKSATATMDVSRHGLGPMVTTITSEADGINIMGVVEIGHVTATATISAHGRSGSAFVKYDRKVTGLIVNGQTVCDTDCPPATVTSAINTALGGRGRIELPSATVVQATNGRLALLQDNPYRHIENVLFDDLSADDVTAPAMTITLYLDESSNSREIVSLASLGGQEIYRVFPLGTFVPGVGPVPQRNLISVGGRLAGAGAVAANSPFVAASPGQQPQVASGGGIGAIVSRAMHLGLRSPGDILGVAILWMLLAVPAYLAARRRLLLDLPRLTPKGNS